MLQIMGNQDWLLLLVQLPSTPSSLRVAVWRRMRAAGAIILNNGAWTLPQSPKNEELVNDCLAYVKSQNGKGIIVTGKAHGDESDDEIIRMFVESVDEEYAEFCERCHAMSEEIGKESAQEKFTFAELDENEEELQKLTSWLRKIRSRDFFGGRNASEAIAALECCRQELQAFEKEVYEKEGLEELGSSH